MPNKKSRSSHLMRIHVSKACASLAEERRCRKLVKSAVAQALHEFERGAKPCVTIRERVNQYFEERVRGFGKKSCTERTAARHRRVLLMFDRVFHSVPLDAIMLEDMLSYMRRRLKSPRRGKSVSGDTVNAETGVLKAFARWAQGRGEAPAALQLLQAPRIQTAGKIAGKNWKPPKVMGADRLLEIMDMIKRERRDIGLFLYGMLYFNLRPSEVADLRRGDLQLPKASGVGTLEARRIKTHKEIALPIPADSLRHEWAEECLELSRLWGRPTAKNAPLIISITGRSRRNPDGWTTDILDQAVGRVCRKAGIKVLPYVIRHSIISYLNTDKTVPRASVSAHAGHAKQTTTDIYSHRTVNDALPAFEAVEKLVLEWKRQTGGG